MRCLVCAYICVLSSLRRVSRPVSEGVSRYPSRGRDRYRDHEYGANTTSKHECLAMWQIKTQDRIHDTPEERRCRIINRGCSKYQQTCNGPPVKRSAFGVLCLCLRLPQPKPCYVGTPKATKSVAPLALSYRTSLLVSQEERVYL